MDMITVVGINVYRQESQEQYKLNMQSIGRTEVTKEPRPKEKKKIKNV